jgi:MFS family permease
VLTDQEPREGAGGPPRREEAGRRAGPGQRRPWRFWATAYTLFILLVGTNIPTPLYRGYEMRFGFSPLVVTLIFAVYVAALIPSLLLAGTLSDAIGRRAVVLPALGLAVLGSLGFALATSTGWLFAGRILQGLAVGAASGALTASLSELEPVGRAGRAALVSTLASVGGLGVGPVLTGLLASWVRAPEVVPFVVEVMLLLPAVLAVAALPTTRRRARWRPRRPRVPVAMRGVFATSGAANFLAFAVTGLFLALVPTYVASLLGSASLLLGAGTVALMMGSSAVVQVLGHARPARRPQLVGLPVLAAGLGLLVLAGTTSSFPLLLAATTIGGLGHGAVFRDGLAAVTRAAPADSRAEVLSTFYVVVYAGVGLPVIGVGVLADHVGLLTAVKSFAGVVAVLCVVVAFTSSRAVGSARSKD